MKKSRADADADASYLNRRNSFLTACFISPTCLFVLVMGVVVVV